MYEIFVMRNIKTYESTYLRNIFFKCKRGYFCKLKTDFHIGKIDVIKLSKSQLHWKNMNVVKSSNFFLFAIWSCCTNYIDNIWHKTQKLQKIAIFFFSNMYWRRGEDFLRFNILLLYSHNGLTLKSEPLKQA